MSRSKAANSPSIHSQDVPVVVRITASLEDAAHDIFDCRERKAGDGHASSGVENAGGDKPRADNVDAVMERVVEQSSRHGARKVGERKRRSLDANGLSRVVE